MRDQHRAAWLLCVIAALFAGRSAAADTPLHERIDRAIEAGRDGRLAAPATDGEFVRRVHLDLTGMIPTATEARAFLDDPSPYKREKLIDRLLDSPEFARRMQVVFDVMLMERRPATHVPATEWEGFLLDAFSENRPLDQVAREILSADGADPAHRGPARFALDREGDPNLMTRDVGRLFLGRDMQCAQCHDHVLYDDYKQAHYYGLFAFFNRSYLVQDAKGIATLGEKAEGDVTFKSVFKKKITNTTGPRVLYAEPVAEPAVAKGQEYWVAPAEKVRAVPRYSRRAQLAKSVVSAKVPEFNRNLANRLWAIMMGRGIVHPLDLHTAENPPSHPELLEMLARELAAMGFDGRKFLRELALTRTYARSSEPPPGLSPEDGSPARFAVAVLKPLSPEQFSWSVMQATGIVAATRAAVERTLFTVDPKLTQLMQLDDKRRRFGRRLVESAVYDGLKGNSGPFIAQFGRAAGQSQDAQDASVHQALFLSNGQPVLSWLDGLAGRLATIADASAMVDELYLSVLTRRPMPDEREEAIKYLAAKPSAKAQAVHELAWALLTSTEFRFNH
ncbi:MAG: hypothetical protein JWN86_3302 [Planctomycetota bacterium]|nr:hypothetical protein [Planctomycetota bacterium]